MTPSLHSSRLVSPGALLGAAGLRGVVPIAGGGVWLAVATEAAGLAVPSAPQAPRPAPLAAVVYGAYAVQARRQGLLASRPRSALFVVASRGPCVLLPAAARAVLPTAP